MSVVEDHARLRRGNLDESSDDAVHRRPWPRQRTVTLRNMPLRLDVIPAVSAAGITLRRALERSTNPPWRVLARRPRIRALSGRCRPGRRYPSPAVFDTLSDKLQHALGDLRGRGRLDEESVSKAMREIRLALLEADVNLQVVKDFVARVKERAVGEEVTKSLTPGQQVVKIVHEELTAIDGRRRLAARLRAARHDRDPARRPPGLGQDDGRRQARADAAQGGEDAGARRGRPPAPGRDRPARAARPPDPGPGLQRGAQGPGRGREAGRRAGAQDATS